MSKLTNSKLARYISLRRKKPINAVNPKRRKRRYVEAFGDKADWIRAQNCAVCFAWPSEAAHVKSRGAGGKAEDLLPLCRRCHASQHRVGVKTFARTHNLDLAKLAAEYEQAWREHQAGDERLGF